jgi:hypothetical protein
MEFPKIKDSQFVLIRADRNTGHLLDLNNQMKLRSDQSVFVIFDSIELAKTFAANEVANNSILEFTIYDYLNNPVLRIDKNGSFVFKK